jgi:hypothetical protein
MVLRKPQNIDIQRVVYAPGSTSPGLQALEAQIPRPFSLPSGSNSTGGPEICVLENRPSDNDTQV